MLANLALALLSAALTAALFLLVLLLVEGWRRSPAVAAVAVTAVPVAALAAGPLFRGLRAGTRSEAVAGSVLIAGGLIGLALLPGAKLVWTIAPQVLVGLGLGLSIDSLTAAALRDRIPRALHGGLDDRRAARGRGGRPGDPHADLHRRPAPRRDARPRRRSPASCSTRRCPPPPSSTSPTGWGASWSPSAAACPTCGRRSRTCACRPPQAATAASLEVGLEDQLERAATRAFRTAFLVAAGLALLALAPALALSDRRRE